MSGSRRAGLAAVVFVSLVLPACGGGSSGGSAPASGVTAKQYMATTCSAMSDWLSSILSQVQDFKTQVSSASSLKQARTELVALVGQTEQDTDVMISKVKAMGPPAVSNGEDVNTKLLSAFGQVRSALATAQQKADQLPTNSPAAFKAGATKIGNDINSELSGIGKTLSDFGPELDAAASSDPNCQKLSSQTGQQ